MQSRALRLHRSLVEPGAVSLGFGALLESEERFARVAEKDAQWVWETDAMGHYVYTTSTVANILGYSATEILGRHLLDFVAEGDRDMMGDMLRQSWMEGRARDAITNQHIHRDGNGGI